MKAKELKQLSLKQLEARLIESRKKLQELRFKLAAGKLKNPHQVSQTKKDIARILTFINQKKKEQLQK